MPDKTLEGVKIVVLMVTGVPGKPGLVIVLAPGVAGLKTIGIPLNAGLVAMEKTSVSGLLTGLVS